MGDNCRTSEMDTGSATYLRITSENNSGKGVTKETPMNSDTDGDKNTAEISLAEDVATVSAVPSKPARFLRVKRAVCQLGKKTVLNFTFAAAFVMLTEINLGVFLLTQVTSLEREFGFTSLQSGRLLSANEIGFLCFVLPWSYLAHKLHVPRALALTALCVGLAGILSGLPHFLFPLAAGGVDHWGGNHNSTSHVVSAATKPPAFCQANISAKPGTRCETVYTGLRNSNSSLTGHKQEVVFNERAYPVFFYLVVFQVVRGAMGSPRLSMFAEYIETNSKKTDAGFYFGIVAAIAMLGPAIAFLGGGYMNQLHVSLKPTQLTPTHPEWVGAWWLGMLVFGSLAALAPVFLWRFPRRIATIASQEPAADDDLTAAVSGVAAQRGVRKFAHRTVAELRDFVKSILRLVLYPALLFLILSSCLFGFSMNGTYMFLPKYLQEQFNIPSWKASYIMGGAELSTGPSGFLLGGWLSRRFQLTLPVLYKLMITTTSVSVLLVMALMFIGCPQPHLIGTPGQNLTGNVSCISSCACPEEVFLVCDRSTSENYFSPCHAGCNQSVDGVFVDCICTASGQVHPGLCPSECPSVYFFSTVFYTYLFILSVTAPMNYLLLIRTVDKSQIGLTVGLNSFAVGIVGFLIGPMVFGGLIDSFCQHWKTSCGFKGQCSVYDNDRFRVQMHLYSVVALGLASACLGVSFVCYKFCLNKPTAIRPSGTDVELREDLRGRKEDPDKEGENAFLDATSSKLLK